MTIVYDKLMALDIAPAEQIYDAKDCMLYALGVGLGHDPMNEDELAFVYEKNLKVLPTMATVLGHQRLAGAQPRQRHRLGDGGQRRAGFHAGAAARRTRRADRPTRGSSK